jgi:hypothetical protein
VGALLPVVGPPAVAADAAPTTVTFTSPGQHAWVVPAGVTRVDVVAVGGQGADSAAHVGGRAARITGTIDVAPGETLYAVVGTSASGSTPGANGGGAAGPGCPSSPGAGGGASDVRTIPLGEPGSDESRIVVAGGGGGAGASGSQHSGLASYNDSFGGHRGQGGGSSIGGYGGRTADDPGPGGNHLGGDMHGTATAGGHGQVGDVGSGRGCGGGGGGGYGGGGGGAASDSTTTGGGGGGGGSLVPPGGFPQGMATRGEAPTITFSTPGTPSASGPLSIELFQTFKQNDQGNGVVPFTNCPDTCDWVDGDLTNRDPARRGGDYGYVSTQRWGSAAETLADFNQAFASIRPSGDPAALGAPFVMTYFAHYNQKIRGDSPTSIGLQTLLTVHPPAGDPAVFEMRGPQTIPLTFTDTANGFSLSECDPEIQITTTPCDDLWEFAPTTSTTVASGVTWHFELLGWKQPDGTFTRRLVTEEQRVSQAAIYGIVTIDTNPTTSVLTTSADVLTMTTTPVPQTGGTVDFTDGGDPIAGCTDVPVDTTSGKASCTPTLSGGSHTLGGAFGGSFGYAASQAAEVPYTSLTSQTIDFTVPSELTYGDADVPLGATASSGLPVTYSSATPATCTTTAGGALHVVAAGECTVTAAQAGDGTYAPASETRPVTIAKATLTVTADDKTRQAGEPNPVLTATTAGFVNGDTPDVVSGTPTLSTTADASSPPGTYPIDVSVASVSAVNYDVIGVPGTLTVVVADPFAACAPGAPTPTGYRLVEGTDRNDQLLGTAGKDLIRAGAGNDLVLGFAGDDILCGGPGNDYLLAAGGNDLLDGGSGLDLLPGAPGTDRGRDADVLTLWLGIEQRG